jgi:hypothetical protein
MARIGELRYIPWHSLGVPLAERVSTQPFEPDQAEGPAEEM